MKKNFWYAQRFAFCLAIAISIGSIPITARAQIVQVPTIGNFSISTAVSVPDSGAGYMGGNRSGRIASQSRGPFDRTAIGSQMSAGGASVHATIIDLDEFDRMIRSQVGKTPFNTQLNAESAPASKYANANPPQPTYAPAYEYLYVLSHPEASQNQDDTSDAAYYLELAHAAKLKGHWHAVDLYYKMAWKKLPENRRNHAIEMLAQARAKSIDSNAKKSTPRSK